MQNREVIVRIKGLIQGLYALGSIFCLFGLGNVATYFSSVEKDRGVYIIIAVVIGTVGIFFLGYALELRNRIKKLISTYEPK